MTNRTLSTPLTLLFALRSALLGLLLACTGAASAATADISNSPLAAVATAAVRANLMFVLDDSGSMGYDYVPEDVDDDKRCFGYSGYNRIFYNPNVTYLVPVDSYNVPFAAASFTAAMTDGYKSGSSTTNLSSTSNLTTESSLIITSSTAPVVTVTGPTVCGKITSSACSTTPTTSTSTSGDTLTTTSKTYVRGNAPGKTCSSTSNSCTRTTTTTTTDSKFVNSKFYWATLKAGAANDCNDANYDVVWDPSTLTAAQKTNYANWYSYYRTRMYTMRAAAGRVFNAIDGSRFRIGFSTISSTGTTDGSKFLNIADFDQTQKDSFYAKLYSTVPNSYTMLRSALVKAGKYYAKKNSGQTVDPVQYMCQRNYTILSSDGYWNTSGEPTSNYIPTKLDGTTAIGNQDAGTTARPMLDDGKSQNGNWVTGGAGVSNSLADIAMYFYNTDLRTSELSNCTGAIAGQDVCANEVKTSGKDTATHQHMTTFTLGLGVSGDLTYQSDYETATSGDFHDIKNAVKAWPDPKSSSNGGYADTGSTVTSRIDDLWHAAINGRGNYYSASDAADLVTSLSDALETISSFNGTGAAATTSSLIPVTGDNFVYLGQYTTVLWEGNVKALTIDTVTGAVSTTPAWEARETLKSQVSASSDARTIYFFNSSATNKLASFTFANLNTAGKGGDFQNVCLTGSYKLSQCADLATAGGSMQADANSGTNLVNFLRGQTQHENLVANASATRLFRSRPNTPLGDIVNAAPVYVKKPPFKYTDAGYSSFVAANAERTGVVYIAANDGMLHAFSSTTGAELWAYVPTAVVPNMYRLADFSYSTNHRFYVDGTPVVGDVYDGSTWRTILVGGLGAGGRGYYALDVTDPSAPKALWEISSSNDSDLGLSYGNPVITKNKAGTWVVAFSSGYNNVSPGAGNGYLYVRNALTGASLSKIPTYTSGTTPAGSAATPNNLGRINGWLDSETNNTTKRFYGGDMLGNMWRFDFDDNLGAAGNEAQLLGRAQSSTGTAQPITTKPQLVKVRHSGSDVAVMAFATGRFLGSSDVGDSTAQSLYVVKDSLTASSLGVLRSHAGMVQQTMTAGTRLIATPQTVDWTSGIGWYVDLNLSSGERINVDMLQTANLLIASSNVPAPTICTPGGTSWLYMFDIRSGGIGLASELDAITAGLNLVQVAGNSLKVIQWDIQSKPKVTTTPSSLLGGPGSLRRSSWRELIN